MKLKKKKERKEYNCVVMISKVCVVTLKLLGLMSWVEKLSSMNSAKSAYKSSFPKTWRENVTWDTKV